MYKADVVIIGAGAVGCAIARELTKYKVSVLVVEKREDVGGDASKSNSAIIHTGYDAAPAHWNPNWWWPQTPCMTK